jgi:site-specific DNA-methyltransferase (adenine-specific)
MDFLDKIICGDCLEVMRDIPDNFIDAIITDPPFVFAGGISNGRSSIADTQFFLHWWRDVCKHLNRILKPTGEGFIWCDWKSAPTIALGLVQRQRYTLRASQMLYHYREMPGQGKPFRSSVDLIMYIRGKKSDGHRIPNTTHNMISKYWYYGRHPHHSAEKDPEICEKLIEWCSDEQSIIIDPFAGAGATLIACKRLNRHYIGIEKEPEYCAIAENRLAEMLI